MWHTILYCITVALIYAAKNIDHLKPKNMSTVKTLLIGVAVGAALGILFAPAKGSKTRRRLARKGGRIKESWNEFKDTVSGAIENIREEVDELADKAEEQVDKLQSPNPEQWRTT